MLAVNQNRSVTSGGSQLSAALAFNSSKNQVVNQKVFNERTQGKGIVDIVSLGNPINGKISAKNEGKDFPPNLLKQDFPPNLLKQDFPQNPLKESKDFPPNLLKQDFPPNLLKKGNNDSGKSFGNNNLVGIEKQAIKAYSSNA